MLLAFDIGNSNVTVGLYDEDQLKERWRLETVSSRTADEYSLLIRQFLGAAGVELSEVKSAIIASVVPVLTSTMEQMVHKLLGRKPLVVGPGLKTGIRILYEPQKDVGADRIVNAVAAYARYQKACIVVDFGTATTFDSIADGGTYSGGAIAPGIQISMEALFTRAAKLPKVAFARPKVVVGRNTAESMQSGLYFGYVALVDGLVSQMRAEMVDRGVAQDGVAVIATGGLAPSVAEDSATIEAVDEDLTLSGLAMIHALNQR